MPKTKDYLSARYWNYFVDFVPIHEHPHSSMSSAWNAWMPRTALHTKRKLCLTSYTCTHHLIMGQVFYGTDLWPTWPTHICRPIWPMTRWPTVCSSNVVFSSLRPIQPRRSAPPSSRGKGLGSAECRLGLSLKVGDLLLKSCIRRPHKLLGLPKRIMVTTKST